MHNEYLVSNGTHYSEAEKRHWDNINTGALHDFIFDSNENTLILEPSYYKWNMVLKVVDGSIKIGWPEEVFSGLHWETTSEIFVTYSSDYEDIEIKWYNNKLKYLFDHNPAQIMYVKNKCMRGMKMFFDDLVSAGKLLSSKNNSFCVRYTATA